MLDVTIVPFICVFQKIKHILTKRLGYCVFENDPSLIHHPQYGLALVSHWEILVYCKDSEAVKDLLSKHFLYTCISNKFAFLGYEINFHKYVIHIDWYIYAVDEFSKLFTESEMDYIADSHSYPTSPYFQCLEKPLNANPRDINEDYITKQIRYDGLDCPYRYDFPFSDTAHFRRMISVLNHITGTYRWDLQYYSTILSRYSKFPNSLAYMSIMDVFRYIYSTKKFVTLYNPLLPNVPMTVDIYTSGDHKTIYPKCSNFGFIINISQRYWHSKSQRITENVKDFWLCALDAAYNAVEYVVRHHATVKSIEQYCNKKNDYTLYIDNWILFNVLIHNAERELSSSWKNRLHALKTWLRAYDMTVCIMQDKDNPAYVLTRDVPTERKNLFFGSEHLRYVDEGYVPCSEESDEHIY